MIKKLILGMFLLGVVPTFNTDIKAQTYTTESKSCGSCGKKVSNNSRIGMTCPHCGVRWGYENETRTTREYNLPSQGYTTYDTPSYYDYSNSFGFISSNANLRSQPTTKSKIVTKIPAYTSVSIISKKGAWYYVSVQKLNQNYNYTTYRGYIHSSLIH